MTQAKAEGKWHLVLRSHKALLELVKICDQLKPKIEDTGPEELAAALRADLIDLICMKAAVYEFANSLNAQRNGRLCGQQQFAMKCVVYS